MMLLRRLHGHGVPWPYGGWASSHLGSPGKAKGELDSGAEIEQ